MSDSSAAPSEDARLDPSEYVRVHEAGHAIIGHAVGMDVREVIGKNTGHVTAFVPRTLTEYQRVMALATYYAAGIAAERIILGETRSGHGNEDRAEIEKLRRQHPDWSADIDGAVARADALVNAHRAAIVKLARRLREAPPTVRGDDLGAHLGVIPVELLPPAPPT